MSEKSKPNINKGHQALARAGRKLWDVRPKGRRTTTLGKTGKVAGTAATVGASGITWGGWLITWLLTKLLADNPGLDKLEKEFDKMSTMKKTRDGGYKESKVRQFLNKNPRLASYLSYYLMLMTAIGGTYAGVEYGPEVVGAVKERVKGDADTKEVSDDDVSVLPNTFGAYKAELKKLFPELIAELVALEGTVVDEETGLLRVYDDKHPERKLKPGDKLDGKATIGFGSTVLPNGKEVDTRTPSMTYEEAYENARWHVEEKETMLTLYSYAVGAGLKINNAGEALALMSGLYNAGGEMIEKRSNNNGARTKYIQQMYEEYGDALPDSVIREAFAKYPLGELANVGDAALNNKGGQAIGNAMGCWLVGGRGQFTRRMVEYGLATGEIDARTLLDMPLKCMYDFLQRQGGQKEDFWQGGQEDRHIKPGVIDEFKKWLANPLDQYGHSLEKKPRVRDVLPPDVVAQCERGKYKFGVLAVKDTGPSDGDTVVTKKVSDGEKKRRQAKKDIYVMDVKDDYHSAVALFRAGDYKKAAKAFEKLLANDNDNALLHNDLAATYNKLGEYDKAIEHAREILLRIGDHSQYAAAQYNAGYAYEQKGDLANALKNYKLSVGNGNAKVRNDVKRVEQALRSKGRTAQVFNRGDKKLGNMSATIDYLKYLEDEKNGKA